MQFDVVLNQPDAGSLSLSLADVAAQDIAIGKLLEVNYRGGPIGSGGMYIENIQTDLVASGDKGGQWKKISGRGGLVLLEDAIIWSETDTSRTFTAVTMGSILVTLINEAKARGCFPVMRVEFSATQDSSGALWTDSTTITLQTGTSLLDVARQFSELGIDFKLIFDWPRNDFALYAYQSSFGIDRSSSVVLRPGLNCEELGDDQESSGLKNAYLVPYQVGITSTSDAVSIEAYRRRETMFQASNAPSSGSALVLANAEMNAVKDPKRSIRIKINDAGGPMAGVDYDLGDWVGVDWQDGSVPSKYRIRGMSYSWDAGQKYASIILTLNSIKIEQEIRSAIALKKIANGSLGSSVSGVAPDGNTAVDMHDADANAHVNRPMAGDLGGTLGAPVVAKLRGVALKNPLNISDGQVLKYSGANAQIEPGSVQWEEIQGKPAAGGGMENPMTASGDIIIGGVNGTPSRLAAGTNGQFLTLANGAPGWTTPVSGNVYSERISSTGTSFSTAHTFIAGSLRVYLNGVRQDPTQYTEDSDLFGFTTTFSVLATDILEVDYDTGVDIGGGSGAATNPRLAFDDICVSSSLPSGVTAVGTVSFDESVLCRTISGDSSYETPSFVINGPLVIQVQCENSNNANTGHLRAEIYRGTTLLAKIDLQEDYNEVLYDGANSAKGASGSSGSPKTGWRYKLSISMDSLGMTDGTIEGIAGGIVTTARWPSNPSIILGDSIKLKISTSGTRSVNLFGVRILKGVAD